MNAENNNTMTIQEFYISRDEKQIQNLTTKEITPYRTEFRQLQRYIQKYL